MTTESELLDSLETYLREDLQDELTGMLAYKNRVAANLLAILRREAWFGPRVRALDEEFARQHDLAAEDMPRALARALRDGLVEDGAELRRYLRLRSLLVLAP